MLTNEDRKQILNSVLDTVECISDKEYQKRVWIDGKGPEVDDFDETCCFFFGDVDPLLLRYRDFGLSKSQYLILQKLRNEFRIFSDNYDHPCEFICSPEWEQIMKIAKQVLHEFDYKKNRN